MEERGALFPTKWSNYWLVVHYYITCGANRGIQWNKSVVSTSDIIDGLTPNTEYVFQVAAVNVNGTGPFSEPITLGGNCR